MAVGDDDGGLPAVDALGGVGDPEFEAGGKTVVQSLTLVLAVRFVPELR